MTVDVRIFIFLLISWFGSVSSAANHEDNLDDILSNNGLNIFEVAKKYGYPLKVHRLVTEDGYNIEMHRIPYGRDNINQTGRSAILLTPGLGFSSLSFVHTGYRSMAFTLAEANYDVWMYNTRGTSWSRSHVKLNPDYRDFWFFSWHEIGIYDYPACIDYIINTTEQEKIFFMGFSQGATSFAVLMSERVEYNAKIRLAFLLGSTIYTAHNKHSSLLYLAKHHKIIRGLVEAIGLYEFPSMDLIGQLCSQFLLFCAFITQTFVGFDPEQIDEKFIPVYITDPTASIAMMFLEHYAQILTARKFQKMDYGSSENLIRYGSESPPEYDISKITAPIALFCGRNDPISSCEDVADLADDLPNLALKYVVPYEMWTHLAFLFGNDAPELVYKIMIELMQDY